MRVRLEDGSIVENAAPVDAGLLVMADPNVDGSVWYVGVNGRYSKLSWNEYRSLWPNVWEGDAENKLRRDAMTPRAPYFQIDALEGPEPTPDPDPEPEPDPEPSDRSREPANELIGDPVRDRAFHFDWVTSYTVQAQRVLDVGGTVVTNPDFDNAWDYWLVRPPASLVGTVGNYESYADERENGGDPDPGNGELPADASFALDRGQLTKVTRDDGRGPRAVWGWENGSMLAPSGCPLIVTLPELSWWLQASVGDRIAYLNAFIGPRSRHGFNGGGLEIMGDIHRHGTIACEMLAWLIHEIYKRGGMVHLWWAADPERLGEGRWHPSWLPGGSEWPALLNTLERWLGSVHGWSIGMGFDNDESDPTREIRKRFAGQINDRMALVLAGARAQGPNDGGGSNFSSWDEVEPSMRNLDYAGVEPYPAQLLDDGWWERMDREFPGKPRFSGEDRIGSQGSGHLHKRATFDQLLTIIGKARQWRDGMYVRWWDSHDRGPRSRGPRSGTDLPDAGRMRAAIWSGYPGVTV